MNRALSMLFAHQPSVRLLQENLPRAFEVADAESRRIQQRTGGKTYESVGQEVGVVRERILIAYLRHVLGDIHIELPSANTSMRDVLVFELPLEIKTVTGNGRVKAKWTADAESAQRDIVDFAFDADLLLTRIWWGQERDSVFYIPSEALKSVAAAHSPGEFLISARGTNNRGIDIAPWFMQAAENHPDSASISINWERRNIAIDPMARWLGFWADQRDRDPLYG